VLPSAAHDDFVSQVVSPTPPVCKGVMQGADETKRASDN
jgi:hypothetical protein